MFASRAELVQTSLQESDTDYILCDRFYDASIAYQGYGRGLSKDFIYNLIEFTKCPIPKITFLLDLDVEDGFKRKLNDKNLAIVETRDEYKRDKTWSFWKVTDHNFDDCVIKSRRI